MPCACQEICDKRCPSWCSDKIYSKLCIKVALMLCMQRLTLKNDGELTAEHIAALSPRTAILTALEMPYHRKQGWGSNTQFTCLQRLTFKNICRMSGNGASAAPHTTCSCRDACTAVCTDLDLHTCRT